MMEEVDEKIAKSEADQLHDAIERQQLDQDHIIWILSTRNQCQLKATFNIYKQDYGNPIDKVLPLTRYYGYSYTLMEVAICWVRLGWIQLRLILSTG